MIRVVSLGVVLATRDKRLALFGISQPAPREGHALFGSVVQQSGALVSDQG